MKSEHILVYAGLIFFILALFPLIYNAILNLDTSAWTFTGHEAAAMFLSVFPYLWIAFGLGVPIYAAINEEAAD